MIEKNCCFGSHMNYFSVSTSNSKNKGKTEFKFHLIWYIVAWERHESVSLTISGL
jgi:hypothetical protein